MKPKTNSLPRQQAQGHRKRRRWLVVLLCFLLSVGWFFKPSMVQIPIPTDAWLDDTTGLSSSTLKLWIRWGIQMAGVMAFALLIRPVSRLLCPLWRRFQIDRRVRYLAGEWFDLATVVSTVLVGMSVVLVAVLGYHLIWLDEHYAIWDARWLANDFLTNHAMSCLLALLLTRLAIGRPPFGKLGKRLIRVYDQGRRGGGGSARFGGVADEAAVDQSKSPGRLYMGKSLYAPARDLCLPGPKHMFTIGTARGGWKGSSVIIPNILRQDAASSLLVIDPKGANAAVTARYLREQGKTVHIVSPFADQTSSFNPLDGLAFDGKSTGKVLTAIANALIVPSPNQRDRHWTVSARCVVAGMLGHILTTYENPSIPMLRDLLTLPSDQLSVIWHEMAANDLAAGLPREAGARMLRSDGQSEMHSVISTIDANTQWLGLSAFQDALGSSDFALSDLKASPTAIFVCIPVTALKLASGFCRLFVALQLADIGDGERSRRPTLMIVDEAAGLGKLEMIPDAYRMLTSHNFTVWLIAQDLPSMQCYGDELNSIISSSRALQVLSVGDLETAKKVSATMGTHVVDGRSVPLRMPDEVMHDLEEGLQQQYILRTDDVPLVLRKVQYFNDPVLRGRYDQDPDYT